MITINQLREISMRYLDSQSIALVYMLSALDEILIVDNEMLVYPKNLYCKDQPITLYVFSSEHLLMITYDLEVTTVITKSLRYLEQFEYDISESARKLTIEFVNGEKIYLHPKADTTLPYVKEFNTQLVLICRYLQDHS